MRLSPTAWLDLADLVIELEAAEFTGETLPDPTEEQQRLMDLNARAMPDPAWGTGKAKVTEWARSQAGAL